jgi:hypothetical protein
MANFCALTRGDDDVAGRSATVVAPHGRGLMEEDLFPPNVKSRNSWSVLMEPMERSPMSLWWTHVHYGHPSGAQLTLQSELPSIA